MLFEMGQLVITRNCLFFCEKHEINVFALVARHQRGDWGDLDEHDVLANTLALHEGTRLFSSYVTPHGKIWIITNGVGDDGKRDATTVLLPEDY